MATRGEIDQQYRVLATITGAMVMGQLLFAGAAWFLNSGSTETPVETIRNPITYAWIAFSLGTLPIAFFLRQRLSNLGATSEAAEDIRTGKLTFAIAQTQTIIMFALLEGAGLLGLVNYFLNHQPQILAVTLAYIITAALIFFPRRSWFDAFH